MEYRPGQGHYGSVYPKLYGNGGLEMKDIYPPPPEFTSPHRFRPWEITRLWVLYGVPLKSFRDVMESLMFNMQEIKTGPYIYEDEEPHV